MNNDEKEYGQGGLFFLYSSESPAPESVTYLHHSVTNSH